MSCGVCGGQLGKRQPKYCSRACASAARRLPKVSLVCERCGGTFEEFPHRAKARYCSKACWGDRRATVECRGCGVTFKPKDAGIYCSRPCAFRSMRGPLAARWKDGKSLERERLRLQPEVRVWRRAVFERDRFTCQDCGSQRDLHAHHIKTWAEYPDDRFDVANGVTLCSTCHGRRHGRFLGRGRRRVDLAGVGVDGGLAG